MPFVRLKVFSLVLQLMSFLLTISFRLTEMVTRTLMKYVHGQLCDFLLDQDSFLECFIDVLYSYIDFNCVKLVVLFVGLYHGRKGVAIRSVLTFTMQGMCEAVYIHSPPTSETKYRIIRSNCRGFNNLSYTIHLRLEYLCFFI